MLRLDLHNNQWNLQQWFDFLTDECSLEIGEDFRWGWQDNSWCVEFPDSKTEVMVRLKIRHDS